MRFGIAILAFAALFLASTQAEAASCSSFVIIKNFDPATSMIEVAYERGNMLKFFPKPEGTPRDATKIPSTCRSKVTRHSKLHVKSTGGRLTMTQVRSNFEGKMLNDTKNEAWLPNKLKELIDGKTEVVAVIRPGLGKDEPLAVTTIYLPITDEELAEIKRLEDQAEDV